MTNAQGRETSPSPATYVLGATCVAFNEIGYVLIARRRHPERWELPGGLLNPQEAFHDAAARETYEETGVCIEVDGLVGIYQHPSHGILACLFIASKVSGVPRPTTEVSAAEWTETEDALQRLHPLYRPRLEDALAARNSVALRVHEGITILSSLSPQCM